MQGSAAFEKMGDGICCAIDTPVSTGIVAYCDVQWIRHEAKFEAVDVPAHVVRLGKIGWLAYYLGVKGLGSFQVWGVVRDGAESFEHRLVRKEVADDADWDRAVSAWLVVGAGARCLSWCCI